MMMTLLAIVWASWVCGFLCGRAYALWHIGPLLHRPIKCCPFCKANIGSLAAAQIHYCEEMERA